MSSYVRLSCGISAVPSLRFLLSFAFPVTGGGPWRRPPEASSGKHTCYQGMAFEVWTPSDYAWVAERAEDELRILESHHPHRFDSLKHELASLLSDAQSFLLLWPPSSRSRPADIDSISSASACTAESSSYRIVRKRKSINGGREMGAELSAIERRACECGSGGGGGGDDYGDRWMDGADSAIDKARACLRRIREVKKVIRPTDAHGAAA